MDSSGEASENVDFTKLKVPELKKELKSRGLSTAGNKTELLERLQNASKNKPDETMSAASVDDLDDLQDLLNDEDDEHIDDDTELHELDANLVTSPKSLKRKSSDSSIGGGGGDAVKQPKKIVLNRNVSSTDEVLDDAPTTVKKDADPVEEDGGEKKVIKLSQLSTKERLEMRAKKFGMPLTVDAKLVARAERFGMAEKSTPAASTVPGTATASLDVLKQRAERFGVNVSTALSKLEQQQRLEKRKERFGATANGNNGKLQERAERFKQPVK